MRIIVELNSENDANLLKILVKRLKGKIIEERKLLFKTKKSTIINPFQALEKIARRGGIVEIADPAAWQKDQRTDRILVDRDL